MQPTVRMRWVTPLLLPRLRRPRLVAMPVVSVLGLVSLMPLLLLCWILVVSTVLTALHLVSTALTTLHLVSTALATLDLVSTALTTLDLVSTALTVAFLLRRLSLRARGGARACRL